MKVTNKTIRLIKIGTESFLPLETTETGLDLSKYPEATGLINSGALVVEGAGTPKVEDTKEAPTKVQTEDK